jgi:hypothetical protein
MVLDHHRTLAKAVVGGSRICGESRDSNSGFQNAVGSAVNYAQENTKTMGFRFRKPPLGSHIDRTKRLPTLDPRPRLADVKKRFAERDRRQATDTRSAAEKWLGDPPRERSALAQRKQT